MMAVLLVDEATVYGETSYTRQDQFMKMRIESDTLGDIEVPDDKYWGCLLYTSDAADE